jgi:hypothetical protein
MQTTSGERAEVRANHVVKYAPDLSQTDWSSLFRGQRQNLLTGTHGLGAEALAAGNYTGLRAEGTNLGEAI